MTSANSGSEEEEMTSEGKDSGSEESRISFGDFASNDAVSTQQQNRTATDEEQARQTDRQTTAIGGAQFEFFDFASNSDLNKDFGRNGEVSNCNAEAGSMGGWSAIDQPQFFAFGERETLARRELNEISTRDGEDYDDDDAELERNVISIAMETIRRHLIPEIDFVDSKANFTTAAAELISMETGEKPEVDGASLTTPNDLDATNGAAGNCAQQTNRADGKLDSNSTKMGGGGGGGGGGGCEDDAEVDGLGNHSMMSRSPLPFCGGGDFKDFGSKEGRSKDSVVGSHVIRTMEPLDGNTREKKIKTKKKKRKKTNGTELHVAIEIVGVLGQCAEFVIFYSLF